jgi:hypothetical protein
MTKVIPFPPGKLQDGAQFGPEGRNSAFLSQSRAEDVMGENRVGPSQPVPLGQRLLDSPFLLLLAGLVIMFIVYTGWGLMEILTLPKGLLP